MRLRQNGHFSELVFVFNIATLMATASPTTPRNTTGQFTFTQIPPSTNMTWYPCEGEYFCAMLDVPLDYSQPQGARASVPLIKLAADPNSMNGPYKGMILTNPGGPGNSGVQSVLTYGSMLQSVAGTNFDIVAFDPRGIANSIPSANCSSSPDTSSPFRRRSKRLHGPKNANSYFPDALDNAISLGVKCKAAIGGEYDAGPHMTTATNVRDMISIVAKFTETEDGQSVANPNLVNYWGLSYGTFIGETLAAMFPDRIGSVILDGVVDPEDNVTGLGLHSLQFTDDAVSTFFVYCHLAGPSACSYYTGTSAADIFERFEKTFTQLDARHAAAQNLTNAPILEAALESLKEFVSLATYYPIGLFPILSDVLLSFETALSNLTVEALEGIAIQIDEALPALKSVPVDLPPQKEWYPAVACSDTNVSAYGLTIDNIKPYIHELERQSVMEGESWGVNRILCAGWNITSSSNFAGPFGGKTKNPVLFISNTIDPATPIYNSHKYVRRYEGARLLTIEGVGHTTIATLNSCAFERIGMFFQTGALPDEHTVCPMEAGAFNVTLPALYESASGWDNIGLKIRGIRR